MAPAAVSRRDVFRSIATTEYLDWPAYDLTPLYGLSPLTALIEDFRTVSGVWFEHDAHDFVTARLNRSERCTGRPSLGS